MATNDDPDAVYIMGQKVTPGVKNYLNKTEEGKKVHIEAFFAARNRKDGSLSQNSSRESSPGPLIEPTRIHIEAFERMRRN